MSIRYECEQCGSVLKIKDDLAGKPGKCPKCKTAFTVPAPSDDLDSSSEMAATDSSEDSNSAATAAQPTESSGEFDVDAFLLSEDEPASAKSKPKSAKSSQATKEIDADQSLDELEEKPKSKRSKSRSDEDNADESFQIRRGPDSAGKLASASNAESDEQATSSRRPPGTNPNAVASNIASDLLAKSSKKGKKANWEEATPEKKKEGPEFDWDGLWYEARTKLLPVLGGGAALCLLVYFVLMPMFFGGKSFTPDLGAVTGTVTVGGKPLAGAMVWFHPEQKKKESKGKSFHVTASVSQTDATGRYELMYDPKDKLRGAVIGKCRVEITTTDYAGIKEKYYLPKSDPAIVEVKAGSQVINLELSK